MVQAGEVGGSIDIVLETFAATMEKQVELNRKDPRRHDLPDHRGVRHRGDLHRHDRVHRPVFKKLFASLGGKLPPPTLILITISNIVVSWPWILVVIAVIVGVIVGVRRWIKPRRAADVGQVQAAPRSSGADPQGGAGPVRHTLASLSVGRADPGGARHRVDVVGKSHSRATSAPGEGRGPRRPSARRPVEASTTTSSRRSSSRWSRSASRPVRSTTCCSKVGGVLRRRGRPDRRQPDVDPRAPPDRDHGSGGRRHGHLPLPADVRLHQAGPELGRLIHSERRCWGRSVGGPHFARPGGRDEITAGREPLTAVERVR